MPAFAEELIGRSPAFRAVLRAAEIAAAADVTALILGESGTGKELLARAMHAGSRRAQRPFVAINCAALPESLAESLLFGHRKGAYTGANADHAGHIGNADGGTLFLDEVGELSPMLQAKLLRVLETGECQALGDTRVRRVDVRIIAATNRDLHAEAQAGRFRHDLYYRLYVVPLDLPPLRERPEDVPLLVEQLTARLAAQHGLPAPRYSAAALQRLQTYAWPGNVRELRNLCERLLVLLGGRDIEPAQLPLEMRPATARSSAFALPAAGLCLDELEADLLRQALSHSGGNRSRAARLLGLTRDTFLYRLRKYAIG